MSDDADAAIATAVAVLEGTHTDLLQHPLRQLPAEGLAESEVLAAIGELKTADPYSTGLKKWGGVCWATIYKPCPWLSPAGAGGHLR